MRILVVGAGGTGGYFGGRLAQAGRDVTFLVRAKRAAALREGGLQVLSPHGDVTVRPKIVTAAELDGTYDLILMTVKAFSLEAALADVAPAIGAESMILPTLNGMKHIDAMIAAFGAGPVVGCVCKVAATIDAAGRIKQLATFQELAYGELDGTTSARTQAADAALKGAGFEARLTGEIGRELWEKWIFLASLGGITCAMRGTVGDVVAAAGGTGFALAFLDECIATARAHGQSPSEGFIANAKKMLTAAGSPTTSSMYRDLAVGNPIEGDQIVGDLLSRARAAGVAVPLLATAYTHLCVYQNRLAAAAA